MAKEVKNENEVVISAVTKAELFLENNKKTILAVLAALVVLCGACVLYYKFVYLPAKAEAAAQMYKAESNFRNGNYELALEGDGNVLGFEQIAQEYGSKAGKAVYFYAAICEMLKDEPDAQAALKYLSKYSTSDVILAARAEALKGDAYCNLENYEKAAGCFMKAAEISENVFAAAYLLKAGEVYEKLAQNDKALKVYKEIKEKYPQSYEAYEINKYITRLEVK